MEIVGRLFKGECLKKFCYRRFRWILSIAAILVFLSGFLPLVNDGGILFEGMRGFQYLKQVNDEGMFSFFYCIALFVPLLTAIFCLVCRKNNLAITVSIYIFTFLLLITFCLTDIFQQSGILPVIPAGGLHLLMGILSLVLCALIYARGDFDAGMVLYFFLALILLWLALLFKNWLYMLTYRADTIMFILLMISAMEKLFEVFFLSVTTQTPRIEAMIKWDALISGAALVYGFVRFALVAFF